MKVKKKTRDSLWGKQVTYVWFEPDVNDVESGLKFAKKVATALNSVTKVVGIESLGCGEIDFRDENRYYKSADEFLKDFDNRKEIVEDVAYDVEFKGNRLRFFCSIYEFNAGQVSVVASIDASKGGVLEDLSKKFTAAYDKAE